MQSMRQQGVHAGNTRPIMQIAHLWDGSQPLLLLTLTGHGASFFAGIISRLVICSSLPLTSFPPLAFA